MGDDLPVSDHIVRYVKPSLVRDDGSRDGSSFHLRTNAIDSRGLAVNWLEAVGTVREDQLSAVRELSRVELRRNGRFAELNIGTVLEYVMEEFDSFRIVHDPLDKNDEFVADPSHASMNGLPPGDSDHAMLVGDMISKCVTKMHPSLI